MGLKLFRQFSLRERQIIEWMLSEDRSLRTIARLLQRSPSSVSREIRRNTAGQLYRASYAQSIATARKRIMSLGGRHKFPKFRFRLFPYRHTLSHALICWCSDLEDYIRINQNAPKYLCGTFFRHPSLYPIFKKPYHYSGLITLGKLLLAHRQRKRKPDRNGQPLMRVSYRNPEARPDKASFHVMAREVA
ncbi:hypothetical protein FUAX_24960 [Fulvitalea axinellae]|uniref:Transposase IS30-like HTH domain-containing protein n=1 Tax=Fulvitalea axinellae TaxID=1182444 RepID=A0AAU9CD64_9BACT|nr:hypothetical protein FUAX_24960 [Fulvitalea axinellae]